MKKIHSGKCNFISFNLEIKAHFFIYILLIIIKQIKIQVYVNISFPCNISFPLMQHYAIFLSHSFHDTKIIFVNT